MLIERYKSEDTCHCLFPHLFIHFLYKNVYPDLHTGISNGFHPSNEFDDCSGGDRMGKVNTVRRNGDAAEPRKAGGGDKCNLVHHRQRSPPEECVVMVGIIGENSFKNAGFRSEDFFF